MNSITFTPHMYVAYIQPQGFLTGDMACHALFYYSTVATFAWERVQTRLIMEGDKVPPPPNYHQLFLSIAKIYGVDPNAMENYWELVDRQCDKLGITRAPNAVRHGSRPKIIIVPEQETWH